MTIWIVVLILALVLSPLAWLKPSRRQSGQMAVRLQARRMGLAMQLVPQQWPHWLPVEPPSPCAQYYRPRSRSGATGQWCYWQLSAGHWCNQWREPCTDPTLLEAFGKLPANAYKVEAGSQIISVSWGEKGAENVLQDIAGVLKALA